VPDDRRLRIAKERLARDLAAVPREPGAVKPDAVVVADDVQRRFGGLVAVDVDHLEIQRGAITALIGPNGAGKTTLFNLLTGFDRPDAGSWSFDGTPLARMSAARVARAGMVRTFQLTKALARMTVLDNLRLAGTGHPGERMLTALVPPLWRAHEAAVTRRAEELLARFRLDHMRDELAGNLSGGQRKLLEMARALMTEPKVVMLDEPMAGVNPALTQSLLGHIQDLREEGMTVVFVEHDMHMVRHVSDWVVVMAQGRIVAEGPPDTIMQDEAVVDAYLGAHHDTDLGDDALLADEALAELEAEVRAEVDAESVGAGTHGTAGHHEEGRA
jgi:branched-chain amino acid transport system ATP-binding protein